MKSLVIIQYFFFALLTVYLSSCVSHKQMLMLQDENKPLINGVDQPNTLFDYKVQPGDILNIDISSISSSQIELFTKEFGQNPSVQANEGTFFINGQVISSKGEIELPLIGIINVDSLTTTEISAVIKEKLDAFIKYVTVSTKITNFRVTILGEVRSPGTFNVYNTNMNILQALGQAGDVTEIGNKRKVKLIRKSPGGVTVEILDLSRSDIIHSPYFYLWPNDVIYIEPLKAKTLRVNSPTIQVAVSLVTLVFLILNFTK